MKWLGTEKLSDLTGDVRTDVSCRAGEGTFSSGAVGADSSDEEEEKEEEEEEEEEKEE